MISISKFLESLSNSIPWPGSDTDTILVTDALGVIGYRVANKLLEAGVPNVRVGVKDVNQALPFKEKGAEVVLFDFDKPETYKAAMHKVTHVYLAIPDHEQWESNFDNFLKVMAVENVKHIVKMSIHHSFAPKHDPFSKVPLVKMHRETDDKLAKATSDYTIIMAGHFMSNPTVYQEERLRNDHCFIGASGSHGCAYVSPNDVADVAVKALLHPEDLKKKTLHITGSEVITDEQLAAELSNTLGTKITYENKSLEQLHGEAKETDWGTAADVLLLERVKATGIEEHGFVSNQVERICGHRAETYKDYLAHKEMMTPQEKAFLSI